MRMDELHQDEMDARQQSGEEEFLAYQAEIERVEFAHDMKREEQLIKEKHENI